MERSISNKQKEKKIMERKREKRESGRVGAICGMQAWGAYGELRATSMEQAEHSLLGES